MRYAKSLTRGWCARLALTVCLAALITLSVGQAGAQDLKQGKYITEASARLIKLIDTSNQNGFAMQNNLFSIGGGLLNQGQNQWTSLFTVQLTAGVTYRFLGAGDADAKDVDLQIVDPSDANRVFAADDGTQADAVVDFRPQTTGRYLVRMRLFSSDNNLPCICLGVVMAKVK